SPRAVLIQCQKRKNWTQSGCAAARSSMKLLRARSARSEGNVRPGPRDCIRRHIVADTFRLGTFLQASRSATADEPIANCRAREPAKLAASFVAAGSGRQNFFRRRQEIERNCRSGGG